MKKITKTICLMLSFVIIFACSATVAVAEKHATGLLWDTWESYLENMNETTLRALSIQRPGDVDADGKISASDARLALRAAASLDSLQQPQHDAADVDGNSIITASDARKILRAAAKLDVLDDLAVDTTLEWGLVIGSLIGSGSGRYYWQCSVDREGLIVAEEKVSPSEGVDGAMPETFFVLTPEKTGRYIVTFQLATSAKDEVIDEFKLKLIVGDSKTVSQGEQFSVNELYNSGSGRYNWKCTITPDTGIEVQESTVNNQDGINDGVPVEQVFTFTAGEKGTYRVHFELIASGEESAINEFYVDVTVV